MAYIAFLEDLTARIRSFIGIDLIEGVVHGNVETHVVKDEELGFGAEIGGIANPGAFQISLGLSGYRAPIAGIRLTGGGFVYVAEQDQSGLGREGIEHGGGGIRHQQHVGFVDILPSSDGRPVELDAFLKCVLVDGFHGLGRVLPLAARVGEAQIHIFDILFLYEIQDFFYVGHNQFPQDECCYGRELTFGIESMRVPSPCDGWQLV